ncbi:MAG: FAD-dependent oxidoreductase [Planctomycetales bacterium]|nr:FAD-dependent oxidoreductase [Planctomycetales bacterium]
MKPWRIGIVGGGPGGLMTAYELQKWCNAPLRISIFEASGRLGGKILTPGFQSVPWFYEAGAAEFYDYSMFDEDPLKDLILELGLTVRPMGGPTVVMRDRALANVDDVRAVLGERSTAALLAFDQAAKDLITPLEFYASGEAESEGERARAGAFAEYLSRIPDDDVRHYLEVMIHSDLAAEPSQTSLHYGLQNYLMNDSAYMNLYGIEGGNRKLPERLAESISADVHLEHIVTEVGQGDSGLFVRGFRDGVEQCDEFDFVVIALPHNHLKSVAYRGERLAAEMQRHFDHFHYPAHYLRITVLFEHPFWRHSYADSYWMLDAFGGCCLYDESARQTGNPYGILGWLLGGDVALEHATLSDEELIKRALDQLPPSLAQGRELVKEAHVHRWINSVNAMPGGARILPIERRHCPEPTNHSNLLVVGDYLYDSTLNGVLDSAQYVAFRISGELAEESDPTRERLQQSRRLHERCRE